MSGALEDPGTAVLPPPGGGTCCNAVVTPGKFPPE